MAEFDTVITRGRVVDPDSGTDAIRDVGITDGRIAAVSAGELSGRRTFDAAGLVVAPGFIDLHSHTQSIPGDRMQAFDGVTTVLELESGVLPVDGWYAAQAAGRRVLNYGASAAWTFARIAELSPEAGEPDGSIRYFLDSTAHKHWQFDVARPDQIERILARLDEGLGQGALGIGINNGYAPAAGSHEMAAVATLAAHYGVPTFTHICYMSNIDPQSSYEAYLRIIALSAATGAHMHICHLNSTSLRDIRRCVTALRNAQGRGLPISVEAYPYGVASTMAAAAFLADPRYHERTGADYADITVNATGERPRTRAELDDLQRREPGAPILWQFLNVEENPADRELLELSNLYPGGAVASDAMPWELPDRRFVTGDVWPMPAEAMAHPRSAATFSRFLSQYVTRGGRISLSEGIAKCSLIPAQIMRTGSAEFGDKGRLAVGADADVIAFDADRLVDVATFTRPAAPSQGMVHVLVNGDPVISGGRLDTTAFPGRPVRRPC
jgi:N-acyl-D-glutamate deacylase